jgi:hypothetical protein
VVGCNVQTLGMSTTPYRPGEKEQIDTETEQILSERDKTFEDDRKTAVNAREALADIRRQLKTPQPH